MHKIMLCTSDKGYSRLFSDAMDYYSKKSIQTIVMDVEFERVIHSFSQVDTPDLLLLDIEEYESFLNYCSESGFDEARISEKICLLTEEESMYGETDFIFRNVNRIFKYRNMEELIDSVRQYIKSEKEKEVVIDQEPVQGGLIGFFSPIRRTGQSMYARNLADESGKDSPVLFISLDSFDGGPLNRNDTLADLLYYLQQEDVTFPRALQKVVWKTDHYHEILPMHFPVDLWNVSKNQWIELFEFLKEKSIYKKIFLDFGDGRINGLWNVLQMCDVIYMPVENDPSALQKLSKFERTLKHMDCQDVLEKIRRVYLKQNG